MANGLAKVMERMKALCKDFGIPLKDHRFDAWLMRDGKVQRPGQWNFSPTESGVRETQEELRELFTTGQGETGSIRLVDAAR